MPDLLIGVSLGEPHEPAGIVKVERHEALGEFDGKRYPVIASYRVVAVVGLQRIRSYDALVERVAALLDGPAKRPGRLLVDISRAGRGVLAPMRDRRLAALPIAIKEGFGFGVSREAFTIGRPELTGILALLMEQGRIDAADVPNADALARQLTDFTTARKSQSDVPRRELVDALAMALWWGEKRLTNLTKQPPRPAPEIDCRPPTFDEAIRMLERA